MGTPRQEPDRSADAAALVKAREHVLAAALEDLLFVINAEKDGDFFICAEASDVIDQARAAVTLYKAGRPHA